MNIALFDFCDTLVNFQTADAYVFFVCNHAKKQHGQKTHPAPLKLKAAKIADKFLRLSLHKQCILGLLQGFSYEELDTYAKQYYDECIRTAFVRPVLDELVEKKRTGYKIYLVSGGYDIYLKYFVNEFQIDGCISTKIMFKNGLCQGKFDGNDCLGRQKVIEVGKYFKNLENGSNNICVYSDSKSDLPLMRWAGRGIVVSEGMHQSWANKEFLEEIIWEKS